MLAGVVAALVVTGAAAAPAAAEPDPTALYNSAQRHFTAGDDAAGRAELRELLGVAPGDAEALALQAIWSHYAGDRPALTEALRRLAGLDPARADGTRRVLDSIVAAVGTLPNPLPSLVGPQTAVVVLGYGLLPDGALRPELVHRLNAAWLQAVASPFSPVVVTGGNAQNGVTEAEAMARFLIGRGIPASRVIVENRAGSTVQNALFSTDLLRARGVHSAVVVTSPNHIRRAVADFLVAGTRVVGATVSLEQLVSNLPPPDRPAQRGIYLDATRTFRLAAAR